MEYSLEPLGDLCVEVVDCPHSTPRWLESGVPVIRNYNIKCGKLDFSKASFVDEDTYIKRTQRANPEFEDLVISREAPMGEVCMIPPNFRCCLGQRLVLLKVNKQKCVSGYLLYVLQSQFIRSQIRAIDSTGSIVSNLNIPDLKNLQIPVIDYEKQKKVAAILKLLDDKILLNNKISAELESTVKTFYDYWFVQFEFPNENGNPYKFSGGKMVWNEVLKREIPDGWKYGTIELLGTIIAGGTPPTDIDQYFCNEGIAWVTPKDLSDTTDKYIRRGETDITEEGYRNSSAKLMPKGSVLLTSRAPIGYLGISLNDISTNQGFKSIVPNEKYGSEFIYYTIKKLIPHLQMMGGGSTFKEISKELLMSVMVAIPDDKIVNFFTETANKLGEMRALKEQENHELAALRDFLLPLLMNGQVTFKD